MLWRQTTLGLLAALLMLGSAGCVIGTWPTPEMISDQMEANGTGGGGKTRSYIGDEGCDGVDNDADGSVDEGCACSDMARGCIGTTGAQCGWGVQWCVEGFWAECTNVVEPFTPVRTPQLAFGPIDPAPVLRDETTEIVVEVAATTTCFGIQIPGLDVSLETGSPVMRVKAYATDDGLGADLIANDGNFTATLPNAFGPGIPAQVLTVRATAEIDGKNVIATTQVSLEAD